jgi:hypothetical protein
MKLFLFAKQNRDIPQMSSIPSYRENCKELLSMLKPDIESNLILIAELHRNLGEFEECLELLKRAERSTGRNDWVIAIESACHKGNTATIPISNKQNDEDVMIHFS